MNNVPRFDGLGEATPKRPDTFSQKRRVYLGIQKICLYVLGLCLLLSMETTVLSRLPFPFLGQGGRSAPALAYLLALACAYLFGERDGFVAGCVAGFGYECLLGKGYMLYALYCGVICYAVGLLSKKLLAQNAPSYLVFALAGGAIECVRMYAAACLRTGGIVPYPYLLYSLLPGFFWTAVFALPVYFAVRGIQRIIEKKK